MALEHGARAVAGTVEALKTQPLAIALIVVNILFLVAGGYTLHAIGAAVTAERAERAELLERILSNCVGR